MSIMTLCLVIPGATGEVMDRKLMMKYKWEQEYKQKTWLELNQTSMRRERRRRLVITKVNDRKTNDVESGRQTLQ